MNRWSVQYRFAAVELSITRESVTAKQHGFRQQSHRVDAPSHNTLLLWVSRWHEEGSVKDSKPQGHPLSARALDNVRRVRDVMLRSPCRWAQRQALTLHLKECSVCWILHKVLHYHTQNIQVAQELSEWEQVSWPQFYNEFLDLVENNSNIMNILLSDEARYHVSGYVNTENCLCWTPNIPYDFNDIFCITQTWQCGVHLLLIALLVLTILWMHWGVQ